MAGSTRVPRRVPLVKVHIFLGGAYQGTECFVQPKILIGRGGEADLVLPCDTISRLHTAVAVTGGRLAVEDLGSRNGTYLNGAAIGKAALDLRDELAIGPYVLKLQLLDLASGREIGLESGGGYQDETMEVRALPRGADQRKTDVEIAVALEVQQAYEKSIFSSSPKLPKADPAPEPVPASTERAHKGEAHTGGGKFNGKRTTTKVTEAPLQRIKSKTEGRYRRE